MSGSFFSRFSSIDTASRPDALLEFLDEYAALEQVQEHKRRATDALELAGGRHVLDVGCGTGVDLVSMLERVRPGGRAVGIDVSARAIAEANRRLGGAPDAIALVADVQELPFGDGEFDACRADRTLQHLAEPDRALRELGRVLRPNGRLVILEVASEVAGGDELERHPVTQALRDASSSADEHQKWLPLMLPLLLSRAGFRTISAQVATTEAHDAHAAKVVLHARDGAVSALEAKTLTAADVEDWSAALERAAATGALTVATRGLCLVAEAPDSR